MMANDGANMQRRIFYLLLLKHVVTLHGRLLFIYILTGISYEGYRATHFDINRPSGRRANERPQGHLGVTSI
jgi:hypothetical protein